MFAARKVKVTFSDIDFQVESAPEYKLAVTADENGTATANTHKKGIEEGEKITLIATPNEGYAFKEWQVVKGGVTIAANKFTMPAADVEVKAIFEKDENAGGEEGTHTGDGTHDGTHSGGTHEGGKTHFSATNDGVENGALEAWFSDDPEFDIVEWNAETNRFEHVYTGDKITPAIVVWNGSKILTESVDYTVKYANNVKVAKNGKPATVTITGKGNYSGKQVLEFYVVPKNLADDDIIVGSTTIATNTKANPVVLYNGMKLTKKDYVISNTGKLSADTEIDITAKEGGNYTGKIEGVTIKVVDKSQLKKLKAAIAKGVTKIYNGEAQTFEIGTELQITDAKSKAAIEDENLYAVSYGNNKKAGTAKVTVVGLDEYSGSVTKKFKIQPNKAVSLTYELGSVDGEDAESGYSFRKSGVTPKVYVTVNDSNSPLDGTALIQGVDYKVSYKNNKKVGSAGYTVTFLGNYKGHAAQKSSFSIVAADMTGAEVYVFDMPFNAKKTKGSAYMQKPFVVVNGELLAKSDYTLTYSIDKKAAVSADTDVTVTITGKKNYQNATEATYKVIDPAGATDISKAKVTVKAKAKTIGYTGAAIEFDPSDDARQGELNVKVGKTTIAGSEAVYNAFEVIYLNNVKKGKGTVIVVGNGTDYAGFRAGTFKIGATNIKEKMKKQVDPDTVKDLLKKLFGL